MHDVARAADVVQRQPGHWRSRAYAARYFLGFTAAGGSVALIATLHARGGFTLAFEALAMLAVLVIAGGLIFPRETSQAPATTATATRAG